MQNKMNTYPIPTILKLNFPFFLKIFMFCQIDLAVSCTFSRLSGRRADRRLTKRLHEKLLFAAGTDFIIWCTAETKSQYQPPGLRTKSCAELGGSERVHETPPEAQFAVIFSQEITTFSASCSNRVWILSRLVSFWKVQWTLCALFSHMCPGHWEGKWSLLCDCKILIRTLVPIGWFSGHSHLRSRIKGRKYHCCW
jgi:hypothetical protein